MWVAEAETMYVQESHDLDHVVVFWQNYGKRRGSVTITCFGNAWTCGFGAMPCETIQEFFTEAGVDYLQNKLGYNQVLKQSKHQINYLGRVIRAVKAELLRARIGTV
jgi:hypothetical protein